MPQRGSLCGYRSRSPVGYRNSIGHSDLAALSRPTCHQTCRMLWSIRYRLLCWVLRLLVRCGLDEADLETVVLRHCLKVLRRGGGRVLFATADRALLAAAARVLPRHRRKSFRVGPDTLARWHRDLLKTREPRSLAAARSSSARSLDQAPDRSAGEGESQVGVPQDPRGGPEARDRCLGHDHRHGASRWRTRPGPTPDRADLDPVPETACVRPPLPPVLSPRRSPRRASRPSPG